VLDVAFGERFHSIVYDDPSFTKSEASAAAAI
jgi:hypothetical protein